MIAYPNINPIAFSMGMISVHWYGLMYLIGFMSAWLLGERRSKRLHLNFNKDQISDLIFYSAVGVVVGGRLGYMLIYNFKALTLDPLSLFKVWQGGMSFHGGFIGVMIAAWLYARKRKLSFLYISDFLCPLVPLGLAAGRIGNFINGELWGRISDAPWAMIFPQSQDNQPRHPSQLYEFGLEGLLLFVVVWWYASKPRPQGAVSGVFMIGYALCRITAEFFREPDVQLGFVAFNWLTMGQLLCIPMLLAGIILYFYSSKKNA